MSRTWAQNINSSIALQNCCSQRANVTMENILYNVKLLSKQDI
jgi:hypothetical protein